MEYRNLGWGTSTNYLLTGTSTAMVGCPMIRIDGVPTPVGAASIWTRHHLHGNSSDDLAFLVAITGGGNG
jgi:hypothetical protein